MTDDEREIAALRGDELQIFEAGIRTRARDGVKGIPAMRGALKDVRRRRAARVAKAATKPIEETHMAGSSSQPTGRALTVLNEMVRAGVDRAVALQEVARMGLPGAPAPAATPAQIAALEALSAPARAIYESWRQVGHTHEKALEEVRVSGIGAPPAAPAGLTEAAYDARSARVFSRPGAAGAAAVSESYDTRSARVFSRPGREA